MSRGFSIRPFRWKLSYGHWILVVNDSHLFLFVKNTVWGACEEKSHVFFSLWL